MTKQLLLICVSNWAYDYNPVITEKTNSIANFERGDRAIEFFILKDSLQKFIYTYL